MNRLSLCIAWVVLGGCEESGELIASGSGDNQGVIDSGVDSDSGGGGVDDSGCVAQVVTTDPTDGAEETLPGAPLRVVFGRSVESARYAFSLRAGNRVEPPRVAWNDDTTQAELTPAKPVASLTDYRLTVDGPCATTDVEFRTGRPAWRVRLGSGTQTTPTPAAIDLLDLFGTGLLALDAAGLDAAEWTWGSALGTGQDACAATSNGSKGLDADGRAREVQFGDSVVVLEEAPAAVDALTLDLTYDVARGDLTMDRVFLRVPCDALTEAAGNDVCEASGASPVPCGGGPAARCLRVTLEDVPVDRAEGLVVEDVDGARPPASCGD